MLCLNKEKKGANKISNEFFAVEYKMIQKQLFTLIIEFYVCGRITIFLQQIWRQQTNNCIQKSSWLEQQIYITCSCTHPPLVKGGQAAVVAAPELVDQDPRLRRPQGPNQQAACFLGERRVSRSFPSLILRIPEQQVIEIVLQDENSLLNMEAILYLACNLEDPKKCK